MLENQKLQVMIVHRKVTAKAQEILKQKRVAKEVRRLELEAELESLTPKE